MKVKDQLDLKFKSLDTVNVNGILIESNIKGYKQILVCKCKSNDSTTKSCKCHLSNKSIIVQEKDLVENPIIIDDRVESYEPRLKFKIKRSAVIKINLGVHVNVNSVTRIMGPGGCIPDFPVPPIFNWPNLPSLIDKTLYSRIDPDLFKLMNTIVNIKMPNCASSIEKEIYIAEVLLNRIEINNGC